MRVVGYVRVSREEQARKGVSLEVQEEKVRQLAALHGLELVEVVPDPGLTAKTLKRPGLSRVLAMLKSGEADGVVIAKLDRLTRSIRDWQTLIERYFGEKPGKTLLSVSDSVDTRTAAGRMVLNIIMTVAQWEREAIGERTRDALQFKRRSGQRAGQVPYGMVIDATDARRSTKGHPTALVIAPVEAAVLRKVKAWSRKGWSLRRIASELDARGIPPKRGAKRWCHTSVQSLLSHREPTR